MKRYYIYHYPNDTTVPETKEGVDNWIHWHDTYAVMLTDEDPDLMHNAAFEKYGTLTIILE
jgi:hypothetical protein